LAPHPNSVEDAHYDLTPLAESLDRYLRFNRIYERAIAGFCVVATLTGVYLLIVPPEPHVPNFDTGPLILIIAFGAASVYTLWGTVSSRKAPRRLRVSSRLISFEEAPGQRPLTMLWTDPRFRMRIFDRRGLPEREGDGTPRTVDFIVRTNRGPDAAVSHAAFDAILQEASRHGLTISKQELSSPVRGTRIVVTLSSPDSE
jgi:hypothetical protein